MEEEINGKVYPLWNQFVERQDEWIGGILHDGGDSLDQAMGFEPLTTTIEAIVLRPNGEDSAWFGVEGKDFSCGFDVQFGGIGAGEEGWITFHGYGGHTWRIKQP